MPPDLNLAKIGHFSRYSQSTMCLTSFAPDLPHNLGQRLMANTTRANWKEVEWLIPVSLLGPILFRGWNAIGRPASWYRAQWPWSSTLSIGRITWISKKKRILIQARRDCATSKPKWSEQQIQMWKIRRHSAALFGTQAHKSCRDLQFWNCCGRKGPFAFFCYRVIIGKVKYKIGARPVNYTDSFSRRR